MLEEEISQGKEFITLARNLTPVELDQGSNSEEITVGFLIKIVRFLY